MCHQFMYIDPEDDNYSYHSDKRSWTFDEPVSKKTGNIHIFEKDIPIILNDLKNIGFEKVDFVSADNPHTGHKKYKGINWLYIHAQK